MYKHLNIPAVTPQTDELWDAEELKVATPEKLAWRHRRPGIEALRGLNLKGERLIYM